MTTKVVSVRVALDGKPQIKTDMQDLGKTGEDAGKQIAGGFDQATAAADRQIAAYERMAAAARKAQEGQRIQSNLSFALGVNQSGASAKDSAAFYKEYFSELEAGQAKAAALRAQIDPLGAAQQKLNVAVADAGSLFKSGAISEAEHAAAVKLAQSEYSAAEKALKALANTGGMTNGQMMAFTATIRHSIDAIIAGRPPIQALAMESGNLSYALGGTGLSGVMGLLGKAASAVVSPIGLTIGAIAAGVGVVVAAGEAFRQYIQDQKDLEASLSGVGRASGANAEQMEAIAQATAGAAGVSVASARTFEEAFARTGKIGVGVFSDLIDIVKRYAATTGETEEKATQELAAAFADPAKGAELLASKIGNLDDKTLQYIKHLAEQGDRQGAQSALLKAMIPNLDEASAHTTLLGRAWDGVGLAAAGAWEAMKKAIGAALDGPKLVDQLKDLQAERANAANGIGATINASQGITAAPRALADIDADIAKVQGKLDELGAKAKKSAADAAAAEDSIFAGTVARAVAGTDQYEKLIDTTTRLDRALNNGAVKGRAEDWNAATDALDAHLRAVLTFLTPEEKAQQLAALETKALNDRTPAQKAATAAERERIQIAGQAITSAQANADVERARTKALNEASKAERDRADAVARQSRVLDADTDASLRSAEAYLQSAQAGMQAEAARRALTDSIRKGSDADQRAGQILKQQIAQMAESGARQVTVVEQQVDAQKTLNDQVAAGTITAQQAREQMQIEQTLRPLLIAESLAEGKAKEDLAKIIERLRDAYAGANAEQHRTAAQQIEADQQDQLELMRKELSLMGDGDNARRLEIVRLQTILQLKRDQIPLDSEDAKKILENADNLERVNQQLDQARQARQELTGMFDDMASKLEDFFTNGDLSWKAFGDLGKSILKDLINEMIKLSLINPLKNALEGANNPTLDSFGGGGGGGIFGSIFGSLFGGGGGGWGSYAGDFSEFMVGIGHTGANISAGAGDRRAVSASMYARAPRFHKGGMLKPGEVPFIGLEGERVLNRTETQAYNARQAAAGPARIEVVVTVANDSNVSAGADAKVANNGGMDIVTIVDAAVSKALTSANSQTSRTMSHRFGVTPQRVKRG